jgi:hypothetical protein
MGTGQALREGTRSLMNRWDFTEDFQPFSERRASREQESERNGGSGSPNFLVSFRGREWRRRRRLSVSGHLASSLNLVMRFMHQTDMLRM